MNTNSPVGSVLADILKRMQPKHKAYISTVYNEFCLSTNQLYTQNIFGKEHISQYLVQRAVTNVEKYFDDGEYSFFHNVLTIHLRELKRKHI